MKVTIDLDEETCRMAEDLASAEGCTVGAAVNKILRWVNDARSDSILEVPRRPRQDSKTERPVVESKKTIASEDVGKVEVAETLRRDKRPVRRQEGRPRVQRSRRSESNGPS